MAFKSIPVVAAKVSGSHSNFPVLVKPSVITGLGSITLAEAQSARFYSDSAKTIELAREIVSSDQIWVKVTSLTTTTTIYIDYDGIRSDYTVTDTYGRNNVWTDYAYVLHGEESSGTRNSSTGSNNASQTGTVNSNTGKVENGADFPNNAANYLSIPHFADSQWDGAVNRTLQLWLKTDTASGVHSVAGRWATIQDYLIYQNGSNVVLAGRQAGAVVTATSNSIGTWYKFDAAMNSSNNMNFYRNGSTVGNASAGASGGSGSQTTNIGMNVSGSPTNPFDGIIDEIRLRLDAISADWSLTEYNCQDNNGTFWGTATDVGGGGAVATHSNLLTMGV